MNPDDSGGGALAPIPEPRPVARRGQRPVRDPACEPPRVPISARARPRAAVGRTATPAVAADTGTEAVAPTEPVPSADRQRVAGSAAAPLVEARGDPEPSARPKRRASSRARPAGDAGADRVGASKPHPKARPQPVSKAEARPGPNPDRIPDAAPAPPPMTAPPIQQPVAQPVASVAAHAEPAARRFVEPYRFTADQQRRIDAALRSGGADDPIGRTIFVGAVAYDLALLRAELIDQTGAESLPGSPGVPGRPGAASDPPARPRPSGAGQPSSPALPTTGSPVGPPSGDTGNGVPASNLSPAATPDHVPDPALGDLAHAAAALGERLAALTAGARADLLHALAAADPFARAYGEAYLVALATEVGRVAAAATAAGDPVGNAARQRAGPAGAAPPIPPTAAPSLPSAARGSDRSPARPADPVPERAATPDRQRALRRFIARAGRVYQESFETPPGIGPTDAFVRALAALAEATDTPIPTEREWLQQVFAAG